MAKRRTYMKIECTDCGRNISRNTFRKHADVCKPRLERKAKERAEMLRTMDFENMTLGQLMESGRTEEYKEWAIKKEQLC